MRREVHNPSMGCLFEWFNPRRRSMRSILLNIERIVMATQQEVDDLTTQVGAIKGVLTKIDADIQFLKSQAQNPAITIDALKAAIADLQTSAEVIDAQTPDQPAP